LHDQVCFHCQQCAEKYLKALLQEAGLFIPKIHDCETLLDLLPPQYASLSRFTRGLAILSEYSVAVRYPGENATKRKASSCLRWAEKVREECRKHLGLKPTRADRSPA
jgi:HEPN domain-containing protein